MEPICYTGIGSKKDGNHTKKQFLKIMKKYKKDCSVYRKSLKCKSCKKYSETYKTKNKNKTYKINKNNPENLFMSCSRCKNKNLQKCNVEDYLLFSGAQKGKC